MTDNIRHLVVWDEDHFMLEGQGLKAEFEAYRTYAETPQQLAELEYWDKMVETLNTLFEHKVIDTIDANMIASRILMLEVNNGRFRVKSSQLATVIKEMAAA